MRVLGDIARLGAKRRPEATALIMNDMEMTYAQLNRRVNLLANGLLSRGISPGDTVALLGLNSPDWVVCNLAIAKVGGVVVALNFRYQAAEMVYAVNDSGTKLLLYGPQFAPLLEAAAADFEKKVEMVVLVGEGPGTMAGLMEGQKEDEPPVTVEPHWPVALTYTSGTTGQPKGVLMSHASFFHIYLGLIVEGQMRPGERTLVPLPLFHSAGMHALVGPTLFMGGTAILIEGGFDPQQNLDLVAKYKIGLTMWVPTMLAFLVNYPEVGSHDVSSMERIWYGSSPISPSVLGASREIFKAAGFYQFYGQTETGMATILSADDHLDKSQMTGREMFNSEMRVVDQAGGDTSVGQVGEIIYAQSAHGMIGYHNMPQATTETIKDGWIYTGDLARVEENGYITIADRAKDLIISGAENIYPKEVEGVIASHPAVASMAVFGIPDDIYGESVCAAVVLHEGAQATAQDIIDHCAANISSYKKPKKVDFMEALPLNSMGKVTKNVLREPYWADREKKI